MFAAVDPTRPWPDHDMTTAKWLRIPAQPVPLHDLVATQDGVYLAPLASPDATSHCGDPFVHVIHWNGRVFLEDGHHRAVRAALNGQRQIDARVLVIGGRS